MKIGAVGDIALTHDYDVIYNAKGPSYPFELVQDVLSEHDILIGNLECPFCLGGEVYPKKLSIRAHPGYAGGIKKAGFTVLTLGNNHVLDYREKAFFETISILDSHGIQWCGAGRDLAEACEPVIIERDGISVAIASRCEVTIEAPFYASPNSRGVAPLDLEQLESDIRSLRSKVDIIIVVPHWGVEDWEYPTPDQVVKAHRIIEMGADLVIGHHPHVIQGIEKYRNGYIAYSMGNLLFPDLEWRWANEYGEVKHAKLKMSRIRKRSGILSVEVSKNGISGVRMIPCRSEADLRVRPLKDSPLHDFRMWALSRPITMKNYPSFWSSYSTINGGRLYLRDFAQKLTSLRRILSYARRKSTMLWSDIRSRSGPDE
ncbi:MAG TPA: CapA family protein [Deltaproteobacteria bacterium]|nr:CapA family protein [Deltaproteobacteria bacterium]HQJ08062.1 CapA family protein [Deltaproteobacteria bacterium]